jgi:Ariadne domain
MPTDVAQTAAMLADTNVDPSTMDATYGTAMHESRIAKKRSMDMDRFLHHYARWNAHEESSVLEGRMRDSVCTRLAPVVREAIAFNGDEYILDGKGLSFIHEAFAELVECRSLLRHSYAFSFFRYKSSSAKKYKLQKRHISEKLAFEQFQSELELMTEQISDVVARSHIRATRSQIRFLTAVTSEKRKEFSNVMINILLEEQKDANRDKKKEMRGAATQLAGGGLDTIVGLASRANVDGLVSRTESDESDDAVRESLQEFLTNTGSGFLYEYTSDEDEGDYADWACSACTYVNAGGRRCDMCGTYKS